jgi:hypothetical protein
MKQNPINLPTLSKDVFVYAVRLCFLKKIIFLLQINVFNVFRLFWCADIKNKLKKLKNIYFNVFLSKKHSEKSLLPQCQTLPKYSAHSIIIMKRGKELKLFNDTTECYFWLLEGGIIRAVWSVRTLVPHTSSLFSI